MKENVWNSYKEQDLEIMDALIQDYKYFLDHGKTERECVREVIATARQWGYKPLEELMAQNYVLGTGDRKSVV